MSRLVVQEGVKGDLIQDLILLGYCHPVILLRVKHHYLKLGKMYLDRYTTAKQ
jgi:hypothetical protein